MGLLALVVALGVGVTQFVLRPSRVAQTYTKDAGYFYRMRANFEVKESGERLDFDYVVACNIRLTRWRDGGLSNDGSFAPRVMVKATAGGQALMLRTLEACHGLTSEDGDVPPDVLPLAIWFDDAANLSNGLGYVSEAAYENPLGRLTFHGARVDPATRADWEAWRKKAADEYVERGVLPGPWGYDFPNIREPNNPGLGGYISSCNGFIRMKLPETLRAGIRALWPSEQPRYWALPNEEQINIRNVRSDPQSPPLSLANWVRGFGTPGESRSSGLPTRSGRSVGRRPHVAHRWPAETYPFLWPPLVSALPIRLVEPAPDVDTYAQKLEFRDGALDGFAACQNTRDTAGNAMREADPRWAAKRHVFMVDDAVVRERRGESIHALAPAFVVERDESLFIQFSALF